MLKCKIKFKNPFYYLPIITMTKLDFIYALENEWLITCVRDENNKIDVEETIKSNDFKHWCWMPSWEWLSLKVVFMILEDQWAFED